MNFEPSPPPPRPAGCRTVPAGEGLATALAGALPGDSLCLEPGKHSGPGRIGPGVTVWGTRAAVVQSSGTGDTLRLAGEGSRLLGITVDGSGHRFDLQEAAVHVTDAIGARVEGVAIRNALFGIIVEKSQDVVVSGNLIDGGDRAELGMRGDAIRVWETRDSRIERNRVHGSRDMVIWYSSNNLIADNEIEGGRYGTHLMYSHGNRISHNRYIRNVVGVFAMYSRDILLESNLLAASTGAAGMGIGLKESSGMRARGNVFVRDAVGIYLDNSPYEPGTTNDFDNNAIRLCDIGVAFHASTAGNRFRDNSLRGNSLAVRVDGGGDALGSLWLHNNFDDYAGYDLDGDGFGDVPFELRSLSATLVSRHPQLDFFRGTPAMYLMDAIGQLVPILQPKAILVDEKPRMAPTSATSRRAN